jgi:hypothetical protein
MRLLIRSVALFLAFGWSLAAGAAPTLTTFTLTSGATGVTSGTFQLAAVNLGFNDAQNFAAVNAGGSGNVYQYVSQSFTPTVTGAYIFGMSQSTFDGVVLIYTGSYNPASPPTNLLAANDDSDGLGAGGVIIVGCPASTQCPKLTQTLTAGTTYQVVVTSWSTGQAVPFPVSFYVYGEPVGVGGAPPATASTSVPTLSEWGLIILSGLMAMFGVWQVRRRGVTLPF